MSKSRFRRIVSYTAINGLFAASMYLGFFQNVPGAKNAALFWGWVVAILGTFVWLVVMIAREKMASEIAKNDLSGDGPVIPEWIDVPFDIAVLVVFVWFGHFVLGFFYFMQILGLHEVRKLPLEHTFNVMRSKK